MEKEKIINSLKFYLLATKLKDTVRSGWKIWGIDRHRVESVAEHIYGTCILAIAIDSEFKFDLDLKKAIMMLVLHELEEVIIGDITILDDVTKEEKRTQGAKAIEKVLDPLAKKSEYIELLNEFEEEKTFESQYAKMCDKLECDIQAKLYCEEGTAELFADKNKHLVETARIKNRIASEEARNFGRFVYRKR
jgi:putative hydrolase of HD superfamily